MPSPAAIELEGVRVHNLKDVSLSLPLGKLIAVCGVSGSGKSSLAIDTLLAEGQRRYLETLSHHERSILTRLERPDADRIDYLPPALAVRQRPSSFEHGATVGSVAEIDELLALLFARCGRIVCPPCDVPVLPQTIDEVAARVAELPDSSRIQIGFRREGAPDVVAELAASGYTRAIVDGRTVKLDQMETPSDEMLVVLDRLRVDTDRIRRVMESIETAFSEGDGRCVVLCEASDPSQRRMTIDGGEWSLLEFSAGLVCPECGRRFEPLEPSHFRAREGDEAAAHVRIDSWDIASLRGLSIGQLAGALEGIGAGSHDTPAMPVLLAELDERCRLLMELGLGELPLDRLFTDVSSGEARRLELGRVLATHLVEALYVFDEPTAALHPADRRRVVSAVRRLCEAGNTVLVVEHDPEFLAAADHLVELGPGSGAEGGRVVFEGPPDEWEAPPSGVAGVDRREPPDSAVLGAALRSDPSHPRSTSESPRRSKAPQAPAEAASLTLTGVTHRNLRDVEVAIPLQRLTVVTGVSGSGKTALVTETLYPAVSETLGRASEVSPRGAYSNLTGADELDEAVLIDDAPIGRNSRSNVATFLKVFGPIRTIFAETAEAQARGWPAGYFSFNKTDGGRCRECEGQGEIAVDMEFLPDMRMTCPECLGTRYEADVLDVRYRKLSIAEVLSLTVDEAFPFFRAQPAIQRRLLPVREIGLGYLRLGQPTPWLSGGESQRLKLASHLGQATRGRTLIVAEHPARGLDPRDVGRLVSVFDSLLEVGHTVVLIEHDPQLLARADCVVEMGEV